MHGPLLSRMPNLVRRHTTPRPPPTPITASGSFNDHKQWRGIATRYDKLATLYRGAVVLRAITIWLNDLGDTP